MHTQVFVDPEPTHSDDATFGFSEDSTCLACLFDLGQGLEIRLGLGFTLGSTGVIYLISALMS